MEIYREKRKVIVIGDWSWRNYNSCVIFMKYGYLYLYWFNEYRDKLEIIFMLLIKL